MEGTRSTDFPQQKSIIIWSIMLIDWDQQKLLDGNNTKITRRRKVEHVPPGVDFRVNLLLPKHIIINDILHLYLRI